jgi:mono/diheme cytochrome c family protein
MPKALKYTLALVLFLPFLAPGRDADAHNMGNAILWNREISRIFYQRCASCHRDRGTAFPLVEYRDVQPHAAAIKDAVLSRRMPPWGAVKGFGDFKNEAGLSLEEIELIADWVDSDTPRGNNPNALPPVPKFNKPAEFKLPKNAIGVSGPHRLTSALKLDGLFAAKVPTGSSMKIVAVLPDGHVEPLLWLYQYQQSFGHPYLFRNPPRLPAGTAIQGVLPGAQVYLLPGKGK